MLIKDTPKEAKEKTLVLIKPDSVQRGLVGEIVGRFERVGLKIVAMKFLIPTGEQARKHYVKSEAEITALGKRSIANRKKYNPDLKEEPEETGKKIVDRLVRFLTAGPIVALVLQGRHATAITRKLIGSTEPLSSDVGTIRGDFTLDSYEASDPDNRSIRNLIHASCDAKEAEYEIKVWFSEEEICKYRSISDYILYDVNLDNIKE